MAKKSVYNKSASMRFMEKLTGGPPTFAELVRTIRECEQWTLEQTAKKLSVSRSHLCDVEKGRKTVSPERAAHWARILGYSESQFVRLAIQGNLDASGLRYRVELKAA
jgi:transcriptional regulator with XRE-family HTH domain